MDMQTFLATFYRFKCLSLFFHHHLRRRHHHHLTSFAVMLTPPSSNDLVMSRMLHSVATLAFLVGHSLLRYLLELLEYLKSFLQRAQPLFDLATFMQHAESQALEAHLPMLEELKGDPLYCIACAKQFASKGVYDGHLTGK
jgi:hypothetical protein